MAPELLRIGAGGKYSYKADIYSYGVVLHEIYTEIEPYADMPEIKRMVDVVMFVSQGKRLPIPKHCPREFASLIADAWADASDSRPSAFSLDLGCMFRVNGDLTIAFVQASKRSSGDWSPWIQKP